MAHKIWEERIQKLTPQLWQAHIHAFNDLPNIVEAVFKEHGILETQFEKPFRKGQYLMAMDIAHAFRDGNHIAAEAGTGTGKTLAYGVPAGILGVTHPGVPEDPEENDYDEKAELIVRPLQTVISVHTLSLQAQLESDFNLIANVTKAATGKYPSHLRLSGRDNYFCEPTTRQIIDDDPKSDLGKLATHLLQEFLTLKAEGKINTGLVSELPSWPAVGFELKKNFVSSEINCSRHKNKAHCNYDHAKARTKKANLLSINHTLLALGWPGTWHQKIIDEAHTLENVVVEITSEETSIEKIDRAMNRPGVAKGISSNNNRQIPTTICLNVLETCKEIEEVIQENQVRRARGPLAEKQSEHLDKALYQIPKYAAEYIRSYPGAPSISASEIKKFFEEPGSVPEISSVGDHAYREIMSSLHNIKMFYNQARTLLNFAHGPDPKTPTIIYWTEEPPPSSKSQGYTFKITEADPRPALKNLHFGSTSVMTSATLAGPKGLDSFVNSQGIEKCETGLYPAPFNIAEKMKVVIPKGLAEPGREEKDWKAQLPEKVYEAVLETAKLPGGGGTLVLLTSRADMLAVKKAIEARLEARGILLLAQDGTRERKEIVDAMKTHGKAVTLGLDSFWTGVDIPGNALRHVVITRIPFQVPTPLNEARKEIVEARRENPFTEVDLRHATSAFRQGVGRLLRTTSDDGLITILDPRVLTKAYGKTLLENLPEASRSYSTHEPAISQSQRAWAKPKFTQDKPAWNPTRPPSPE